MTAWPPLHFHFLIHFLPPPGLSQSFRPTRFLALSCLCFTRMPTFVNLLFPSYLPAHHIYIPFSCFSSFLHATSSRVYTQWLFFSECCMAQRFVVRAVALLSAKLSEKSFFFLHCRIALDSCGQVFARKSKRDQKSAHLQESNKNQPAQQKPTRQR